MDRPFSFLIHAGDDKARLAPIIKRLIAADVNLWIDDPFHPALDLTRYETDRLAGYIVPGGDWSQQRNLALRAASSFLLSVTHTSVHAGRGEVHMEAAVADFREQDAGIPVFPLALSQAELEGGTSLIGRRQGFKVYVAPEKVPSAQADEIERHALTGRGEIEISLLVERLLACQAKPSSASLARSELAVSPYLADRSPQSYDIADLLRAAQREENAPLHLPVLLGSIADRPDKFALMKLPQRIIPHILRPLKCPAITVPWPHCVLSDPERALRLLVEEIVHHLPFPDAIVIYAQPAASDLATQDGLRSCLSLWCRTWSMITNPNSHGVLLPILDVRTDLLQRNTGFARIWRGRNNAKETVDTMCAALNQDYQNVSIRALPPFSPVGWNCVEEWLRDEVALTVSEAAMSVYRNGLTNGFSRTGLTMEDWAQHAHKTFRQHHSAA